VRKSALGEKHVTSCVASNESPHNDASWRGAMAWVVRVSSDSISLCNVLIYWTVNRKGAAMDNGKCARIGFSFRHTVPVICPLRY
jgi:hypothetical protein